jgi:CHAT domain-containing protein
VGKVVCLAAAMLLAWVPASGKVSPEQYAQLREEGFSAAQGMIVSSAADALSNVGLRFSSGSGRLSELVRKGADLAGQIGALERHLDKAMDDKGPDAESARTRLRADLKQKQDERAALDRQLDEEFPAYAELTHPKPLSSQAVQAILNPNEAVLVIVSGSQATYIFAITKDKFDWARSSLNADAIAVAVATLRGGLDNDGTGGARFDRATAFKLYNELIKPLEPLFQDKKVIFTLTTGALQTLPLHVLVTDAPQGDDADPAAIKATHWLIDRYALTSLPAVSSLQTLRCTNLRDSAQRHPGCLASGRIERHALPTGNLLFTGVGDPVLSGKPRSTFRAGNLAEYSHGEIADVEALRGLPRLPGTATELNALKGHFRGDRTKLFMAADATETQVKTAPEIGQAKVLAFATHALVAGQTGKIGEPGLVLTPPPKGQGTDADDGLLSASEVARLSLSADFVILSACNTASNDKNSSADGLSGLARAFFYAGARAMLVSNWSVSDEATPVLMSLTFDNIEKDSSQGRAVAFQKAIVAMKGTTRWTEPRHWAAFVLVGDTVAK